MLIMLQALRRKKGMSQEDLSKLVGVTPGMVSRWERGKRTPKYQNLKKISEALECPIETLMKEV